MFHALALAALIAASPHAPAGQGAAVQDGRVVLTIRIVLTNSDGTLVPVPRHVLLVSDSPPTTAPRRLQTASDGTVSVRLRPGKYTVESEEPVTFQGKPYEWVQIVEIAPGRDAGLELTAGNADTATGERRDGNASSLEDDPSMLLARWQDSVAGVWSPTGRGTGFLVDARGLIVTTERAVGSASSAEVQLTPATKIPALVVQADPVRDVAVLRVHPIAVASIRPVPLACANSAEPAVEPGQKIVAIAAPLNRPKDAASATVREIEGRVIATLLSVASGGAGGPVFASGGRLVGITSLADPNHDGRGGDTQVIRIEEVCATLSGAELKMNDAAAPSAATLPVEPEQPFPRPALEEAAERMTFSLAPYRISSPSFDVTFITPVLLYAAQHRAKLADGSRIGDGGTRDPRAIDPLDDFSNWSAYVRDYPPVLMIRVTPKLVEGFWTRIARGAARTQNVALPPVKRFKPGFARLQAFCGDVEVTPIHPFKIEQRVAETDAVYEGLYVFDPGALGSACGTVRLAVYSEKEPQKGEMRPVDAAVVRRVWEDFAPLRAPR